MQFKKILLAAAAAAALTTSGAALAAPSHYDGRVQVADARWDGNHRDFRDHRGHRDHDRWNRHDRKWNKHDRGRHYGHYKYRRHVSHDHIYNVLRSRHFHRFGVPQYHRGHYGVHAYDRYGRLVFVNVNPYTGSYLGFRFGF